MIVLRRRAVRRSRRIVSQDAPGGVRRPLFFLLLLLLMVLLLVLSWPGNLLAAMAPFRIHMILFRGETEVEQGFRDYLADHGVPVEITISNLDRDLRRLPGVIEALKAAPPDLVYTWGTPITVGVLGTEDQGEAGQALAGVPVLFTMVSSPVGARLVREEGASGRMFTGVSHLPPMESQLLAMSRYRTVSRLAVIYNPTESNAAVAVGRLREVCEAQRIDLVVETVPLDDQGQPRADSLPDLVAKIAAREPQFLYIPPDTFLGDNRDVVTEEAIRHRIPSFTPTEREIDTSNALVGLVANYDSLGKLAGMKAEQILVGKVPAGSIPIETLSRFSYKIKMSVASRLGLYPPMALLDYAEIVP